MVGVPGKSKGCTTCRRRKIRCDQEKPACNKCTKSGRICEGYARFPVFLNRTIEGPEKRHGLEEAKTRYQATTAFSQMPEQDATSNLSMLSNLSFQRDLVERRAVAENRMLLSPSNFAVQDQQLISTFWQKYIPIDAYAQSGSTCVWLEQIISLSNPGEVLQLSLKALAATRLGWINKDESLALQGNGFYGRALQEVQKGLWRENVVMHDDIFVAGYILAVYELFESTTASIAGWNSQISGLSQLVQARGPHRHRTPIPRATLEEFRTSAMIQCMQYRKSSFLGTDEWKTIPWEDTPKDVYQKLYDHGFSMAALLEEIDSAQLISPEADISKLSDFLPRVSTMNDEMESWYRELLTECPSPLFWPTHTSLRTSSSTSGWDSRETLEPSSLPPFSFPTLRMANITVTYWGLRTILSNTIAVTCGAILSINTQLSAESSRHGDLRDKATHLLSQHGSATRLEFATNIMRSMPYCLNDNMGLLGAQKSLFALRVALFSLRRHPGEELKWCQAVYAELDNKKGLRYAREVAKLDVRDSASGRDNLPMRNKMPTPGGSASPERGNERSSESSLPDVDEGFLNAISIQPDSPMRRVSPASD